MKATIRRYQRRLNRIGWYLKVDGDLGPATRAVIRKFQTGYAGKYARNRALPINGKLTPRTRQAIRWSAANDGKCSPHFRFKEFASKGNGDIVVLRALVQGLERLRTRTGKAIPVVSGYRDPYYNDVTLPARGIKTARFSQHKYGTASDLPESLQITVAEARGAGFSGIGYDSSRASLGVDRCYVEHADMRHAGPENTTGGRPGAPTLWAYS